MKRAWKWAALVAASALILLLGLYMNDTFGVSAAGLERDARGGGRIDEDWQAAQASTDSIAGLLFYSGDLSESTFSIYIRRGGLSFGYFFRLGGCLSAVDEGIAGFSMPGTDRVFLSMNRAGVSRMEVDGASGAETVAVDSTKPFALAVPAAAGVVWFYDGAGNGVEWSRIDRL